MDLDRRQDLGLLVQSAVFQELFKFKMQHFYDFIIHFWRTQSGAEVDFILYKNTQCIIPIEVKFRSMNDPTISRSFRSFLEAYNPAFGFIITKDYNKKTTVNNSAITFIAFSRLLT